MGSLRRRSPWKLTTLAATGRWRECWQRLRLLSAREWRLLAESWLLCAAIAVVLPRVSFTRLIDVIEGRQPSGCGTPASGDS